MSEPKRSSFLEALRNLKSRQPAGLWLLIGFFFLSFTFFQTVIPLAAWLAPIFLLRFVRTARRARLALPLIFLAYALAILIGLRGSDTSIPALVLVSIVTFPLIRGIMYTLPYAADRLMGAHLASWSRLFIFPMAFTAVDWLLSISMTGNLGSPAYTQSGSLLLLQILSLTGMWGVTFLIMWCASTVNALWENHFNWRKLKAELGVFVGVFLAVLLFGAGRLALASATSQTVEAAAITLDRAIASAADRPITADFNLSSDEQRAAARPNLQASVEQMLARTEAALRRGARLVSWEEGAGRVLEEDKQQTLERLAALARQYGAYLQVSLEVLTRDPSQHFVYNQSILVDDTGAVLWTYNKTHPVFPVESSFTIAGEGELPVADTRFGRLSSAICNDLHFTTLLRQSGQQNVDILIAPYHSLYPFAWEDSAVASYRAIENGFSLLRPAGTGISTITDYRGRMLARQDYFTSLDGMMMAEIPIRGAWTVYSRIGDIFAYVCVAGLVFLALLALVARKQSRKIQTGQVYNPSNLSH
jgi:apolipoprotein N-acyltransferase